ncbi:MAG: acyltransferase [Leptolyngbyaceae cyanobacterium bins.349]|nr:acyltransferase [Leptolyngbyaceae cyanobacterium bins.349]
MKPQAILKGLLWYYQKAKLGQVGEGTNVSPFADLRGRKKSLFIGNGSTICKHATLEIDTVDVSESKIVIGDRTLISSFAILRTYGGTIKIGNSCFVNSFSVLYGHGNLTIGNDCLIGPQVTIVPANYGFQERDIPFRAQPTTMRGITLEDNVWIGAGATILDGCTVGKGAIVAAGAVVTKSVEPYSIVAGVPAKKIATRN